MILHILASNKRHFQTVDSLNVHPGLLCPTLLRPAAGQPLRRPSSTPLDTPSRLPVAIIAFMRRLVKSYMSIHIIIHVVLHMSCHTCPVMPYYGMSCHVLYCIVLSNSVMSCHDISCHVIFCHVLSWSVLYCNIMSFIELHGFWACERTSLSTKGFQCPWRGHLFLFLNFRIILLSVCWHFHCPFLFYHIMPQFMYHHVMP
jgi:hypothetical protein